MFELIANTQFTALHSLHERENLHEHVWKIQVCVVSDRLREGRVISLPELKQEVDSILLPLQNQRLNDHPSLDPASAGEPTCENLSRFIFERMLQFFRSIPADRAHELRLAWVRVSVLESGEFELGSVRYFPS